MQAVLHNGRVSETFLTAGPYEGVYEGVNEMEEREVPSAVRLTTDEWISSKAAVGTPCGTAGVQ